MPLFEKHFTVAEANALLPELRGLLADIRSIRDELVVELEAALPVVREARKNGGGKEAHPYLDAIQDLNTRLGRLNEIGVQIKDVDKGLVDFPAWRGEEEVLLCWHLGEDEVRYWHDLETGFAGRQAIDSQLL
jgi:hypothetical protein